MRWRGRPWDEGGGRPWDEGEREGGPEMRWRGRPWDEGEREALG